MKLLVAIFTVILLFIAIVLPVKAETNHLVISEIQVGGTSGNDEFIELYNPTDFTITLTGWYITKRASESLTETNFIGSGLSKSINPHGYFLISNSSGIFAGAADLMYSTGFGNDYTITLYSDNKITKIDQVGFGNSTYFEGSPAPNPLPGESIERISNIDTDNNLSDFQINSSPVPHSSLFVEETPTPTPTETPTPIPSPTQTPTQTQTPTATGWAKNPVFTCRNTHIPSFVYVLLKLKMPWKFSCT